LPGWLWFLWFLAGSPCVFARLAVVLLFFAGSPCGCLLLPCRLSMPTTHDSCAAGTHAKLPRNLCPTQAPRQ